MAFKDSREFLLGGAGEAVVRKWLLSRGFAVIRTSHIENGGAPCLEDLRESLILPDMQTFKDGAQGWVEVKTKETTKWFGLANRMQTGFAKRHWDAYIRIQKQTDIKVWVAFLHLKQRDLWVQTVDILRDSVVPHIGSRDGFGGEEMVFWPRHCFDVYQVSEKEVGACEPYRAKKPGWITTPPPPKPPEEPMLF